MAYNLFLDDFRRPSTVYPNTSDKDWVLVKSYDEFVRHIEGHGLPVYVSFDHDLSDEHYPRRDTEGLPIDYDEYKEKTGYDCAQWLIQYCLMNLKELPSWHVHSANPVGSENIKAVLNSWERCRDVYVGIKVEIVKDVTRSVWEEGK